MSGITGCIVKKEDNNDWSLLKKMNQAIKHRGPDKEILFKQKHDDLTVGMSMRCLSFQSPQNEEESLYIGDENNAVVLDGSIFNSKILRVDLEIKGYRFLTNSDTELILKLYECYGVESFAMLEGMYAFSVYNKSQNKLLIVRDFFGGKPLYYYKNGENLFWGSELKSIISILDKKPQINKLALNLYFQLTYIPAPYTIYESVFKLEPDRYIEYDLNELFIEEKILNRKVEYSDHDLSNKRKAIEIVHEKVMDSVASRIIPNVSMGSFLSGGVDSSIVSYCLAQQTNKKIDTFSIGFDKKSFDETDKSRVVAGIINSNHHEFIIGEKDLYEDLDAVLLNFDEPFADSSALPSYLVAKKTKTEVNIAMTGDGGDEVFGGYNKYYMGRLNQLYTNLMFKGGHSLIKKTSDLILQTKDDNRGYRFKLRRLINAVNYEGQFYYGIISLGYGEEELNSILNHSYTYTNPLELYKTRVPNPKSIHDFRAVDLMLSLEGDMLVKVDRTSMLSSFECRSPFLNRELWELANQIPQNYLINGWDKKHILKEAFKQYFPNGFLDKSKKGFGVPVGDWLRGVLREELESYIDVAFLNKQGIFSVDNIIQIVKDHLSGKVDNTFRVWTYFCFQKWYKHNYDI